MNAIVPSTAIDYSQQRTKDYYEYRHTVGLEETSVSGNVYFLNHLKWQGRCRELFLAQHAPKVISELQNGLCLLTVSATCNYIAELFALDEVVVAMYLKEISPAQLKMGFNYWRSNIGRSQLVATGEQTIACMRRAAGRLVPVSIPEPLVAALNEYRGERR